MTTKDGDPGLSVQYVDKILDIVEVFARAEGPLGLTEISHRAGINKTTVYRILSSLVKREYVQQDEQQLYSPTYRWSHIVDSSARHTSEFEEVRKHLSAVRDEQDETVHLSVYQPGGMALYIDVLESRQPVRSSSRIGATAPAHCVSTGKALLAFQASGEIDRVLNTIKIFTPHTIAQPDLLRAHLEDIRHSGYSINREEYQEDVCGIAVPLAMRSGEVFAAVGFCVPSQRFVPSRIQELLMTLRTHFGDFVPERPV